MLITKIKRVVRSGFNSFWRNGFVSFVSVFVMVVTLFVIAGVVFSGALLNASLDQIRNKVDINVYFVTGADESDILAFKKTIDALPEVESTEYITKDKALDTFKERHGGDQSILQALDELGDNPLRAILTIKAKDPSQYDGIAKFLQSDAALSQGGTNIVDTTNYPENQAAIERLAKIISAADKLGLVLTLIFILLSVLVTFSTIQLVIHSAKDEISVMRLMGASSKYIRGPFVVGGIMYGLIAGIITIGLLYPITYYVGPFTQDFFVGINLFTYYLANFWQLCAIVLGSGVIIGSFSSYLAVRRHLKV